MTLLTFMPLWGAEQTLEWGPKQTKALLCSQWSPSYMYQSFPCSRMIFYNLKEASHESTTSWVDFQDKFAITLPYKAAFISQKMAGIVSTQSCPETSAKNQNTAMWRSVSLIKTIGCISNLPFLIQCQSAVSSGQFDFREIRDQKVPLNCNEKVRQTVE